MLSKKNTVKIVPIGDIMLDTAYTDSLVLPRFKAQKLFKPLEKYF